MATIDVVVFDHDGTLVDSDDALLRPFLALGVPRDELTFGHVLADECDRLGIRVADYLDRYDPRAVRPFDGVTELLEALPRWAVCSNKHQEAGLAELELLGWTPEIALFADAFAESKQLEPVLAALDVRSDRALFVGDTEHDRRCAEQAGVPFALAAWNPRAEPERGDLVVSHPRQVLDLLNGVRLSAGARRLRRRL